MKRILLSLLLSVLIASAFAQNSCPITYKSNSGGAGCAKTYEGFDLTASIIVTFRFVPKSVPVLQKVTEAGTSDTFAFKKVYGEFGKDSLTVRYCFYGVGQSSNFFNKQGNLNLLIKYPESATNQNCIVTPPSETTLPVHFKSITAARNKERVAIKWETASESNNRGFNVQRNTGSEWKTIAFVFSQAEEGNSSSTLSYEYNDVNTAKGVSQYRVQQVDIDGKASFSEIRSVRGETMKKSVIAFPNPSLDGKVNLVLEDNSAKNVIVSDMSGRIVKQFKNITTNNLTIDMLQSGMYSIQVTDLSTAEVSVEKVVIKKR